MAESPSLFSQKTFVVDIPLSSKCGSGFLIKQKLCKTIQYIKENLIKDDFDFKIFDKSARGQCKATQSITRFNQEYLERNFGS